MRPLLLSLGLLLATSAAAVPLTLPHQGVLNDASGLPLEGEHTLNFAIYADETSTEPLWTQSVAATLEGGAFSVRLGGDPSNPIPPELINGEQRWLGLAVGADPELPRLHLDSVPHAILARGVRGGAADVSSVSINGVEVIGSDGRLVADALPSSFEDADSLADITCSAGEVLSWNGIEWDCASSAVGELDAAAITSGTLDVNRLPIGSTDGTVASGAHSHDAADVATGVLASERIPDLDAAKITSGAFDAARIPDLDAGKITSGAFDAARIPDLDAAKITSGAFDAARIPGLDAAKITSGTLNIARIPDLDAAKTTTGVFLPARIPNLDASKITSGVLDKARLPVLTAADVGAAPLTGTGRVTTGGLTTSGSVAFSGATQQITFWPNGWNLLPTGYLNGPGPANTPNDGFGISVGHVQNTEQTVAFLTINDNLDDAIFIGGGSSTCCGATWRGLRVQGGGNAQLSGTLTSGQGALYADVAENVPVSGGIEAGDVVAVSPGAQSYPESAFVRTATAYDRGVVGVISDSAILNMATEADGRQPLALTGMVKVKVDAQYGAIRPGDLLVSSPTAGHAMRADDAPAGTVIGKALEPLDAGTGRVLMLVMPR